jgi:hypothetical protein
MQRRRQIMAGAVLPLLLAGAAAQAVPCSESTARERLGQLRAALMRPDSMAAIDAAKKDYAADQHFDNEHDARYLAAAAFYFKVERAFQDKDGKQVCLYLEQGRVLIDEVIAGK